MRKIKRRERQQRLLVQTGEDQGPLLGGTMFNFAYERRRVHKKRQQTPMQNNKTFIDQVYIPADVDDGGPSARHAIFGSCKDPGNRKRIFHGIDIKLNLPRTYWLVSETKRGTRDF